MVEKNENFRDYLKHAVGPVTGVQHTQYPPAAKNKPGPLTPISGVELNKPPVMVSEADARCKQAQKFPQVQPVKEESNS